MVQPTKNISRSYPAIVRQLMAMDAWTRPRPALGIRNAWSQARMGSSLIVVANPLPQDRPKMLLAQRDHVIQAFTADRSHQPFTVSVGVGRRLHLNVTAKDDVFASLILIIPGTGKSLN
jgi:hypothetical protein